MRASSLKWSIITILASLVQLIVVPKLELDVSGETTLTMTWLCLVPVLGAITARAVFLSFKKHYDLTPTTGSKIVNVLAKVLSVAAALVIGPYVVMVIFVALALLAGMLMMPFS